MSTPNLEETAKKPERRNSNFQNLPFLFDKQNYMLMGIGLLIIIVGFVMMSGGRSADPNVFTGEELYSFSRITLAPFVVVAGLIVEGYAIMRKPKS